MVQDGFLPGAYYRTGGAQAKGRSRSVTQAVALAMG